MNPDPDIIPILQRIRRGETEAFVHLVQTYEADVRRIIASGLQDFQATDDLVQQTFVNAYFALSSFRANENFRDWLRAIARNLLRDELRRRNALSRYTLTYAQYLTARLAEPQCREDESCQSSALEHCMEKLSPDAREALELRYTQDRNFSEIAETLSRTVAGTRQLLTRVRTILRDCLERSGGRTV